MKVVAKVSTNGNVNLNGELVEFPPELKGGRNLLEDTSDVYRSVTFLGWQYYFAIITNITIGKILIARAYLKPTAEPIKLMLHFIVPSDPNGYIQIISGANETIPAGGEGYVTVSGTVPVGATGVRLALRHNSGATPSDTVQYKELKVEHLAAFTPWTPAPEDLGYEIPNWVTVFNTSFSGNGLITRELIEAPSELYSNPNLLKNTSNEFVNFVSTAGEYYKSFGSDVLLEADQPYTLSWVIEKTSTDVNDLTISIGNGTQGNFQSDIKYGSNMFTTSSITFTPTVAQLTTYKYFAYRFRNELKALTYKVRSIKLEKGTVATSYSAHSSQVSGSHDGTNNTIVAGRNLLTEIDINNSTLSIGSEQEYAYAGTKTWVLFANKKLEVGQYIYSVFMKKPANDNVAGIRFHKNGASVGYYGRTQSIDAEWNLIEIPFTVTSNTDYYGSQIYNHAFGTDYASSVFLKQLKLEKNSVPTIWTPAPEDTGLDFPAWASQFGNPISLNGEGLLVSGEFSEYPNITEDKLELWYDFNGVDNTSRNKEIAYDITGNNRNGTLTNFAYTNSSGYDDGLRFDGVDDRIVTSYAFNISPTAMTAEVFGSVANTSIYNNFMSSNGPIFIRTFGTGVRWCLWISGAWAFINGSAGKITANQNYLFTMTYDGVTLKGYINGVLDISHPVTGAISFSTNNLYIGHTPVGGENSPLIGCVYSVRIYSKTLTQEEITLNYEAEKGRWI